MDKFIDQLKTLANRIDTLKDSITSEEATKTAIVMPFLVNQIYDGLKTKTTLEKFMPIIRKGIKQIINEKVNDKLNAALTSTGDNNNVRVTLPDPPNTPQSDEKIDKPKEIITTPEELEVYSIIKVILKDIILPERIFYRDNKSYFNILIDNNIRKWIVRVFFEKNRNYIVLNDAATGKERSVIEFNQPMNILEYHEKIIPVAAPYDTNKILHQ